MHIHLRIAIKLNIYENTTGLSLTEPRNVSRIQQGVKDDIEERILEASRKVRREFRTDIFGFGKSVYRHHPQAWKKTFRDRWPESFPETSVSVGIDVKVLRTGLTNRPIQLKE
ncbi:Ger(x)C family spore germination C-terminal domain-containing protein [Cohnella caldifontis]|uniref:Ger(x)C family spore germination C-terminal domain-containing protein n=1 Tax=Cohnella caldifontis TaxID=3027471 RepID=UPI0023EBD1CA|nr:Ger(x)C family spore germination C-terminal domain-containing protein [Cohnella sp. YIM B05605]